MSDRVQGYADAMFAVANAEGDVRGISDELFAIGRVVDSNDELRSTISDARIPAERRIQIMDDLLDGKARQATTGLVSMVVAAGRGGDLGKIASALAEKAAQSQGWYCTYSCSSFICILSTTLTTKPICMSETNRMTNLVCYYMLNNIYVIIT